MDKIDKFEGVYEFLSNFSKSTIIFNGNVYPTVEHLYQAMKAATEEDYVQVASASGPGSTKKMGRKIEMRDDWDKVKDGVMLMCLMMKFGQHKGLKNKLLETGDIELIEGNQWGDVYWGVDNKKGGENHLGKLLMKLRQFYRNERPKSAWIKVVEEPVEINLDEDDGKSLMPSRFR